MKRLNLIFISEEIAVKPGDITPQDITPEIASQLSALEGLLADNPQLANDPEIAKLIQINKDMHTAFDGNQQQQQQQQAPAAGGQGGGANTQQDDNKGGQANEFENLPFFGGTKTPDFKGAKPEQLNDVAGKLGFDTAQPDWFEKFISDFATTKQEVASVTTVKTQLQELTSSLEALPKEIQSAIRAVADGKDWRTVIGSAPALDLTKDFAKLSDEAKISIHNYFFPEDKIESNASIEDKAVAKSIKVAQSKFEAEKALFQNQQEAIKTKDAATAREWAASIAESKNQFTSKYPQFKSEDLERIENVIAKEGIASLFVGKDGKLTKEGFERVAFAITGADVLKAAVAIAKNKGYSEGKAEVLKTTQTDGNKGGAGQQATLTDEEKKALELLQQSQVSTQLTY